MATSAGQTPQYLSQDITEEILFQEWLKNLFKLNNTSEIVQQINDTIVTELRAIFHKILLQNADFANKYPELQREKYLKNSLIIIAYTLIIIVSLLGNLLVCKVLLNKRTSERIRTTNVLIVSLTVSDLVMTIFTIPITIVRLILDDWPFGSSMCILAPFIQVTSVYVSTLSMIIIALDRYHVLVNPLKSRLSARLPKPAIILIIWIIAGVLSIPHSIFNRSVPLFTSRTIYRCRTVYPEPRLFYRRVLTIVTFMTQYLAPLIITLITYTLISLKIFRKVPIGEFTEQQLTTRSESKRKTIKMLATVVVVFAVCWLPINVYHIINDFFATDSLSAISINTYLACHWLAFSSVCWNPFIYFGLNPYYRHELNRIFLRGKHRKSGNTRNIHYNTNNNTQNNTNSVALCTRSSTVVHTRNNSKTSEHKFNISLTFTHNICKNVKNLGNSCVRNSDRNANNTNDTNVINSNMGLINKNDINMDNKRMDYGDSGCKGSCSKASMSCVCEDMELYPLRCYDEND